MPYLTPGQEIDGDGNPPTLWLGANWLRTYEIACDLTGATLKSEIRRAPAPAGQQPIAAFTMALVSSTSTPEPFSVFTRSLTAAAMATAGLRAGGSYETDIYVGFPNPDVNSQPDDSGEQKMMETGPLVVVGNITQP